MLLIVYYLHSIIVLYIQGQEGGTNSLQFKKFKSHGFL